MNGIQPSLPLLAGCLALLAVVTAAGIWLKVRVADGHAHPLSDLINLRVQGWWGMTLGLGLALLPGHTGVTLLFALLSFAALREFMTIAPTRRGDHSALIMVFLLSCRFSISWLRSISVIFLRYSFRHTRSCSCPSSPH